MPNPFYYDSIDPESIVEFLETNAQNFITSAGKTFITSAGKNFIVNSNTTPGVVDRPGLLIDQRIGLTNTVNAQSGVRINLSEAKAVQFAAIYAGSVTSAPTITISGSNTSTTGYTQFHSTSTVSVGWNIYEFSSTQTYQYYSIQFNSGSNFTIGEIILGTKFVPNRNPNIGQSYKNNPINDIHASYTGRDYVNKSNDSHKIFKQKWTAIDNTEKQKFESMRDASVDKRIIYKPNGVKYVTLSKDSLKFTEVAHQTWDTELTMTEE